MRALCNSTQTQIDHFDPSRKFKNISLAERQNKRILALLRRSYGLFSWPDAYHNVVYALNISQQKIGSILVSPFEIYFGRKPKHINCPPTIPQKDPIAENHRRRMSEIAELIRTLGEERRLDATQQIFNDVYKDIFKVDEKVLGLKEYVKKVPASLAYKIHPRYEIATITEKQGIYYKIQPEDGSAQRIVHRRQLRQLKQ